MRRQKPHAESERAAVRQWSSGSRARIVGPRPAFCSPCSAISRCSLRNGRRRTEYPQRKEKVMRKSCTMVALVALLAGVAGISTPSLAESGRVAVVFTKGGFIVGVGGGEGVLVFRGKQYP